MRSMFDDSRILLDTLEVLSIDLESREELEDYENTDLINDLDVKQTYEKLFNYRFGANWQTLYAVWISRK